MMGLGNLGGSLDVKVGRSYVAARLIPLMPHHSPSNEYLAIARMEHVEEGETFEVVGEHLRRGYPWFKVRCGDREGWVSGIALVGQDLKEEKPFFERLDELDEILEDANKKVEGAGTDGR